MPDYNMVANHPNMQPPPEAHPPLAEIRCRIKSLAELIHYKKKGYLVN